MNRLKMEMLTPKQRLDIENRIEKVLFDTPLYRDGGMCLETSRDLLLLIITDIDAALKESEVDDSKLVYMNAKCDDCGSICNIASLDSIEDITERVDYNAPTPAGQCIKCGALSYAFKEQIK